MIWSSKPGKRSVFGDDELGRPASLVVEIASNHGYLLRKFVEHNIPVFGIYPAAGLVAVKAAEPLAAAGRSREPQTGTARWTGEGSLAIALESRVCLGLGCSPIGIASTHRDLEGYASRVRSLPFAFNPNG